MSDATWTRLAAPFPDDAVAWAALASTGADRGDPVRAQLAHGAIVARLDEVCGVGGWSVTFAPVADGAIACTLEVDGVRKGAVADARPEGPTATAAAAFADAAQLFGLRPPADAVEAAQDAADGTAGDEPGVRVVAAATVPADSAPPASEPAGDLQTADVEARGLSPEVLRTIDRLVDRLRAEGHGLAVARLTVRYGGYGKDPEAARELYGALRALLVRGAEREVGA